MEFCEGKRTKEWIFIGWVDEKTKKKKRFGGVLRENGGRECKGKAGWLARLEGVGESRGKRPYGAKET